MTITDVQRQAAQTGRADIDTAQQETQEAEQLLAALEERVRAGDPGVKPTELRDARELVGFSRLRVEAAERRAAQLATEARHKLYATLGAEARALDLGDDDTITDAFTDALAALRRLWDVAEERSTKLRDMSQRAEHLVHLAEQHGERDILRAAGIHNGGGLGDANLTLIPTDGTACRLTDVRSHHVVSAALARTFEAETERRRAEAGPNGIVGTEWEPVDVRVSLGNAVRVFPDLGTATVAPVDDQDQAVTADE